MAEQGDDHRHDADHHASNEATDPVCCMAVDPATTQHEASHDGQEFYFCSAGCRTKFIADPDRYLYGDSAPEPETTPGAIWTCPMHPEIRQEGPGTCPICGMALEGAVSLIATRLRSTQRWHDRTSLRP